MADLAQELCDALEKLDFPKIKTIANELAANRHQWSDLKGVDQGNDAINELDGILETLLKGMVGG